MCCLILLYPIILPQMLDVFTCCCCMRAGNLLRDVSVLCHPSCSASLLSLPQSEQPPLPPSRLLHADMIWREGISGGRGITLLILYRGHPLGLFRPRNSSPDIALDFSAVAHAWCNSP